MSTVYKVLITPRTGPFTYGTQIDVSDHIDATGVGVIKKSVDSTDFDVGLFYFGDITLTGFNEQGYLNDPSDYRSIFFPFSRDLAKVDVIFSNEDGDTITFQGLINDAGTTYDVENEEVTFTVLTRDSVIRDDSVAGGTISDGMTIKAAFAAILNVPRITSVLTYSDANNNPYNNFTIDNGSAFDSMAKKDAIQQLLAASNSVMVIDSSSNIIIKNRNEFANDPVNLYGKFDIYGRENILSIKNYNNGLQRMFTSVIITDSGNSTQTEKANTALSATFGLRQKTFDFPFITDANTQAAVAQNILDTFAAPKIEMEVDVPTSVAIGLNLLDLVSVNYPLRLKPRGLGFPVIGVTVIGDSNYPLPDTLGSIVIPDNLGFKIIEMTHDEQQFITTLKLRQIGVTLSDGVLNLPKNSRLGFAVIGDGIIGGTGIQSFNPATIGGARIGTTLVS